MSIKTILAVADGGGSTEATLTTAVRLAERLRASVDVLHVRADVETMVPIIGEGMSGAMVEQMMTTMAQTIETRAATARTAFHNVSAATSVAANWREATGREPDIVAAAGRVSDLIVIGRPERETETPLAATLDAALFDTGRPVLVAPAVPAPAAASRVIVAWNGSAQAARAVAAALPLLAVAEHITVVTVGAIERQPPAAELVAYLARHDVKAAHEALDAAHGTVGAALLAHAEKAGTDLMIMGAYGHSRLREMILGGATRDVLAAAKLPVVMAH